MTKAISKGEGYDEQIEALVRQGLPVAAICERLVVSDVQEACDVLRPVFETSAGLDGYVSLEVSPYLAHDTEGSLNEARKLHRLVERPNVFIKIPGTRAGVAAIEQALFEGIHINITLLFSIASYEAVAEAYLRALEWRAEAGRGVDDVVSVASFFLSLFVDDREENVERARALGLHTIHVTDLRGLAKQLLCAGVEVPASGPVSARMCTPYGSG